MIVSGFRVDKPYTDRIHCCSRAAEFVAWVQLTGCAFLISMVYLCLHLQLWVWPNFAVLFPVGIVHLC